MTFKQSDLDNINSAVAMGELSVEVSGRKVTYRSMDDLLKARSIIAAELAAADVATGVVRHGSYRVRFTTSRGD